MVMIVFFFFSSRRRHTRCYRDWSSDVCSSDLETSDSAHARPPACSSRPDETSRTWTFENGSSSLPFNTRGPDASFESRVEEIRCADAELKRHHLADVLIDRHVGERDAALLHVHDVARREPQRRGRPVALAEVRSEVE